MKSNNAQRIIRKLLNDLAENGINIDSNIADLKEIRPFAIEEKDPTVTKVLRLTYEHLERYNTFHIPIPEEEDEEEEEVVAEGEEAPVKEEKEPVEQTDETRLESFSYLVALLKNPKNKINRSEIMTYRDALMAYGK